MEWVFKVRFLRAGSSDEKSFLKLGTDQYKRQQKEFQRKCEKCGCSHTWKCSCSAGTDLWIKERDLAIVAGQENNHLQISYIILAAC